MKKIKSIILNILLLCCVLPLLMSCNDKDEEIIPVIRYHDCTMWDYMKSDTSNWGLFTQLIERAGLTALFQGTDPQHKEITCFGLTNLSVLQFLLKTTDENGERIYIDINDIPVEQCKTFVLSYVTDGKRKQESFDFEIKGTLEGGTELPNLCGKILRIYQTKSDYYGVPDIGAQRLFIHAKESGYITGVVSSDIETQNGVVHALSTTFQLVEL